MRRMICPETKTYLAIENRPDSRACLKVLLRVFVFFNCLYLVTSTGRVRVPDEALTLFQSQSFVLRRSFTIPQALETNRFYGRYDLNGKPRAPYPPLHALLASPWYAIGHFVLRQDSGYPRREPRSSCLICGHAQQCNLRSAGLCFGFDVFLADRVTLESG